MSCKFEDWTNTPRDLEEVAHFLENFDIENDALAMGPRCTHPEGPEHCNFLTLRQEHCPMFQQAQPLHEAEIEQLLEYTE